MGDQQVFTAQAQQGAERICFQDLKPRLPILGRRLIKDHQVDVYDMRYIDEVGMKRTMETALEGLDADTHLHVSFDVDFLDPSIAAPRSRRRAAPGRRRPPDHAPAAPRWVAW